MSTFGNELLENVGRSIQVSADGAPVAKAGGVTVDWSAIAASTEERIYQETDFVRVGEKFLRYGQILVLNSGTGKYIPYVSGNINRGNGYILNESVHENQPHSDHPPVIDGGRVFKKRLLVLGADTGGYVNEVQTVSITGTTPDGGTFTLTFDSQTTAPIAFDADALTVQAALVALSNVAVGDVAVTGGPGPGTAWIVTFQGAYANTDVPALTGAGTLLTTTATHTDQAVAVDTTTVSFVGPTLAVFEAAFPQISYVSE